MKAREWLFEIMRNNKSVIKNSHGIVGFSEKGNYYITNSTSSFIIDYVKYEARYNGILLSLGLKDLPVIQNEDDSITFFNSIYIKIDNTTYSFIKPNDEDFFKSDKVWTIMDATPVPITESDADRYGVPKEYIGYYVIACLIKNSELTEGDHVISVTYEGITKTNVFSI